jgi:chemotaxis protein MotB
MDYAVTRQFVPASAQGLLAGAAPTFPWESGDDDGLVKQDGWLLSFIDILALLLTLFVLLLAYRDQGAGTLQENPAPPPRVADMSLWLTLGQGDVLQPGFANTGPGLVPLDLEAGYAMPGATQSAVESGSVQQAKTSQQEEQPVAPAAVAPETARAELAESPPEIPPSVDESEVVALMAESVPEVASGLPEQPVEDAEVVRVTQAFVASPLHDQVELLSRPGAVSIEIRDNILFAPASAALSPDGLQLLNELAAVLRSLPYAVSVEGHTDDIPISSTRFPSNWELSSARAAMATRALIEQGIAADRLRAIGYGDTLPREDNATTAGRAKNRRVAFVLQLENGH